MNPRFGYLCLFENPGENSGNKPGTEFARALTRQAILVREADRMRYDDIWITEHHFDEVWPSPSSTALLGHLSGVTTRSRIGSAALLTAFRDPIQVAEDIATLDLITKGRLNLGIATGGPFPELYRNFKLQPEQARARSLEALDLIDRLLNEAVVTFKGEHFEADAVRLSPRPAQPVPIWIATTTENSIRHAARAGYGLMATATATHAQLRRMLDIYRDTAPDGDPKLVLARFGFTKATRAEALAVAEPYLKEFSARMRKIGITDKPEFSAALDTEALLQQSLIGDFDEVTETINLLQRDIGVYGLAIIPTSVQFDTVKQCLADFVDEIRLRLPAD